MSRRREKRRKQKWCLIELRRKEYWREKKDKHYNRQIENRVELKRI
jgi:hypothetical protein